MIKFSNLKIIYIFQNGNDRKVFFFKKSLTKHLQLILLNYCKSEFKQKIFNRSDLSDIDNLNEILSLEESINKKPLLRSRIYEEIEQHNKPYISKELSDAQQFLDQVENNHLTLCQRKAVINSNKHTLTLAGAGSGKTSVIISKIAYLVNQKGVKPSDIVLLAYNRDAVNELKTRVHKKIGDNISIHTFHALGLKLRRLQTDRNSESLSGLEIDQKLDGVMLGQIIKENITDASFNKSMLEFSNIEYYKDNKSIKSTEERRKSADQEFRAITGHKVKSHGELVIANYLYFSGIAYKYEANLKNVTERDEIDAQINPDFYLPDYDVWIEHWAIDKNRKDPFKESSNSSNYIEEMKRKKKLYKELDLKLIETSYGDKQNEILEERLDQQLKDFDIGKSDLKHDADAFFRFMEENPGPGKKILKGLDYYSRELPSEEEFASLFTSTYGEKTAKRLAYGVVKIYEDYQSKLRANKSYTFNCMIQDGITALDSELNLSWKHVIVDEYQDISNMRFKLLKKLVNSLDASLFCVGDDWQSINGFSGSNIKYILDFEKEFNFSDRKDIEYTFRYRQDLADVSKEFVMRDTKLIDKKVVSAKSLHKDEKANSIHIVDLKYQKNPNSVLAGIIQKLDHINDKDILFLFRTNNALKRFKNNSTQLFRYAKELRFKTIHSSKGLEADIVVMMDLDSSIDGLPSGNGNTLFQKCLNSEPQELEERRLFYVGLTRAKENVYIPLVNTRHSSSFVTELKEFDSLVNFVDIRKKKVLEMNKKYTLCPTCREGKLVEKTNRNSGEKFLGCSAYRKNGCSHTQSIEKTEYDEAI